MWWARQDSNLQPDRYEWPAADDYGDDEDTRGRVIAAVRLPD
jgi:hypothetical protein